jgi:hypothetical protein
LAVARNEREVLGKRQKLGSLTNSPATDGDHLVVCRHEQLRCVAHVLVTVDAHPGILCPLWIEREEECLTRTEIRLSLATVVLEVSLAPSGGAVGTENLVMGFDQFSRDSISFLGI